MCYEKTLVKKVNEILEIQAQIKALENKQNELKNFIKKEMDRREVEELSIESYNIYYRPVTTDRFDAKSFKEVNEKLYNKFVKSSTSKRFDIKVATGATKVDG